LLAIDDEGLWLYRGKWYWADTRLKEADIATLVEEKERLRKAKLEALRMRAAGKARPTIAPEVVSFVWQRDGGKCVRCGSRLNLEIGHIIPFSKGGGSTARNLQLLCEACNRYKSDHI